LAALKVFALGVAVAHAAWLWFWLCGSLIGRPRDHVHSEDALLDIVLRSITGIALTGLATFALGLCGALFPATPVAGIVILVSIFIYRGESPLRWDFWARRAALIRAAASPGALIVYFLALVLAVPAIVPDAGSDATSLYLPQALDYARAHRLVVDPWLRFPYYPSNWVLIETWPMVLKLGTLGQFVNWLCGCLTLLGVYGIIVRGARETQGRAGMRGIRAIAIAGAVSLALTAMFVKVLDVGMLDVPAEMFFLATLIATLSALRETGSGAFASLVICAGFLVGVKISFVALLPLFVGLCWIVIARRSGSRKALAATAVVLLAIASPWYLRAFVLAGDPITPVLNLRFHGVDPHFSRDDFKAQLIDLSADSRPQALLVLPFQLFADFKSRNVRDFGATLVVILIPLPLMYVAWALLRRRLRATPLLIGAIFATYGYGYWICTSHLGRYALLFIPCLIAFVGMLVSSWTLAAVRLRYAGAAAMCVFACPSSASWNETLLNIWQNDIAGVGLYYTDANTWLELRSPAYSQIEDVAHAFRRARRPDLRVYMVELPGSRYFVKERGFTMLGDAFGPDRYGDFARALLSDELKPYVERFDIGAFIVPEYLLELSPKYVGISQRLHALGWRESRYPDSIWVLFTAPSVPRPSLGEGKDAPS
jgi:hypothetical protein